MTPPIALGLLVGLLLLLTFSGPVRKWNAHHLSTHISAALAPVHPASVRSTSILIQSDPKVEVDEFDYLWPSAGPLVYESAPERAERRSRETRVLASDLLLAYAQHDGRRIAEIVGVTTPQELADGLVANALVIAEVACARNVPHEPIVDMFDRLHHSAVHILADGPRPA